MHCSAQPRMQMNYDVPALPRPPVVLPVPVRKAGSAQPRAARSPAVLARAHLEAARTEARENLVWLALSIGALLLLFLSFIAN
jgi:hypothetical protein